MKQLFFICILGGMLCSFMYGPFSGIDAKEFDYSEYSKFANPPGTFETMLDFKDKRHINAFIKEVDQKVDEFDYSQIDDDSYEYGDPLLDKIVDKQFGFKSLRLKYERLDNADNDYAKRLPFQILDPDMEIFLNENHEVKMGNAIYKYMSRNIICIIKDADLKALADVRENGYFAKNPKVSFINEFDDSEVEIFNVKSEIDPHPQEPSPGPDTRSCTLSFSYTVETNVNGNYNHVSINPSGLLANGSFCPATYKIEWGDGSVSDTELNVQNHIYPEISAGSSNSCATYTIKITARTLTDCAGGECDLGSIKTETFPLTICITPENCNSGNRSREIASYHFTSGDREWKLEGEVGVRTTDGFLTDEKVWGKTRSYRKKNNGNWKKKRPAKDLGIRIFGDITNNFCNGNTDIPADCKKYKHKRKVKVKYNPNTSFSWFEDGPDEIKADFSAEMTSTTYGVYDFELFE